MKRTVSWLPRGQLPHSDFQKGFSEVGLVVTQQAIARLKQTKEHRSSRVFGDVGNSGRQSMREM